MSLAEAPTCSTAGLPICPACCDEIVPGDLHTECDPDVDEF